MPVFSQSSDFLLLRKHHKIIKTITAGSQLAFATESGRFSGRIEGIKNDSVFLLQYDVRQIPTNLGIYVLDTVSVNKLVIRYRDIIMIGEENHSFNWQATGGSLFGGGILLTTVGLGTWIFTKPGTQYHASTTLIVGSAALAAIGYAILRSNSNITIRSKYHLEYISISRLNK